MSMMKFLSFFALAGVFIPLIFQVIWWLLNKYQMADLKIRIFIQQLMLIIWPSSIMMLPTGSDESLIPIALLISTAVNVVLYVIIGLCIWYGFTKHYVILVLLAFVMIVVWWRLLTL